MPLSLDERESVTELIRTTRTVAAHLLTLHLQLGALRTALARKGTVTLAEFDLILHELNAATTVDEAINPLAPSVDAVFVELLRRLEESV